MEGGSLASHAFAAEPTPTVTEGEYATAPTNAAEALRVSLSEPTLSEAPNGSVRYTTTLTVEDVNAFYGYQIQVAAPTEDDVALNNLVSGTVTEAVYRDGSVFLAVLASEEMSGDLAICEIVSDFAPGVAEQERNITIAKVEVVASIASETFLTLGPDPAAAVLALPPAGLFGLPAWVVTLGVAVLLLAAAIAVILLVRKRRHNRQPANRRGPAHRRLELG
jgi:hypothetical protein